MAIASFVAARDHLLGAGAITPNEACSHIVEAFAMVAPFAACAVMSTDPATHLPASGVVRGFDPSACEPYWDNELLDPDFLKFNDLARMERPVASLADATDGELGRSPRFQKLFAAYDASDEFRVVFQVGAAHLGIGDFVRCDGEIYSPTQLSDIAHLLPIASELLRSAHANAHPTAPTTDGPVVLLLDGDGNLVSASPHAEATLADLRLDQLEEDQTIPGTVYVAASRLRTGRVPELATMLRGKSGRWLRLHAARMEGQLELVSITIEDARPGDIVGILLDAYNLTDRETQIVLALCRGLSTKEIAAELAISVHTVRDHLKVIYDKAAVNSRGELVANLFTAHVLEPFEANVTHV